MCARLDRVARVERVELECGREQSARERAPHVVFGRARLAAREHQERREALEQPQVRPPVLFASVAFGLICEHETETGEGEGE